LLAALKHRIARLNYYLQRFTVWLDSQTGGLERFGRGHQYGSRTLLKSSIMAILVLFCA